MSDEPVQPESEDMDHAEAVALLAAMFNGHSEKDFPQMAGPLLWPTVTTQDAPVRWSDLRAWVEGLIGRFEQIDHHVIPLCWWRHNGHVEALLALRDHERVCYSDTSPPSAAVEWHRAFRDIETRLREWTSTLPCGSHHDFRARPTRIVDEEQWVAFVAQDAARRPANQPTKPEASNQTPLDDDSPAAEEERER